LYVYATTSSGDRLAGQRTSTHSEGSIQSTLSETPSPTFSFTQISDESNLEILINSDLSERSLGPLPSVFDDRERMKDKVYLMLGYPSKIFYKSILALVKAHTKEGDLVVDPMCGSGSTAIACLLTRRKCLASDGSAAASFIAHNYIAPVDVPRAIATFEQLREKVEPTIDQLYSIPCRCEYDNERKCEEFGIISYVISSDVHSCKYCGSEMILAHAKRKAMSTYACPNCGRTTNLAGQNGTISLLERRRPTLVRYLCRECKCGTSIHKREMTASDRAFLDDSLRNFERRTDRLWYPETAIVYNRAYPRPGGWPGIGPNGKISDLFSRRNLLALAILFREIEAIHHEDIREFFKFCFIGSLIRSSRRVLSTSVFKEHYRVPPVGKEANAWHVFQRKFRYVLQTKQEIAERVGQINYGRHVRVLQRPAETMSLPDNSVDYVFLDPPYGGYIPFYELNLFYSAWLGEKEDFEHEIIIPMDYEKKPGYVAKWGGMMLGPLREIRRTLKPGRYVTLAFHSNFASMWNELRKLMVDELGFRFIRFIPVVRGTTFHMNREDDTIPTSAYITYQKPILVRKENMFRPSGEINDILQEILKRRPSGIPFREIQGDVIRIVHERGLRRIPSEAEIHRCLSQGRFVYDPERRVWKPELRRRCN